MRAKGGRKGEIALLKSEVRRLKANNGKVAATVTKRITAAKKQRDIESSMVDILKYFIEESKATRTQLDRILDKLEQFEAAGAYEENDLPSVRTERMPQTAPDPDYALAKEVVIGDKDAKIIAFIQRCPQGLACADDVKRAMSYKGRNAASSRLNKLYKQGLLERHQAGHKVYYRFTGGTLASRVRIVSPPEESQPTRANGASFPPPQ